MKLPTRKLSDSKNQTNSDVRRVWVGKKTQQRIRLAAVTSLLIIIGFELTSPDYSTTTLIVESLYRRSELVRTFAESNFALGWLLGTGDSKTSHGVSGSHLKYVIWFVVAYVVLLHFNSSDPLSNPELLRNLVRETDFRKPYTVARWMQEISYYAKQVPSNQLPKRCSSCATSGCGNKLANGDKDRTYRWNAIIAMISEEHASSLLSSTHSCRRIFLLRYSLWGTAAILIVVYFLSRLLEYFVRGNVDVNLQMLGYIFSLWFVGIVLGFSNSVKNENARGVWGHFSETVQSFLQSDDYKAAFERAVCKYDQKPNRFSEKEDPSPRGVSSSAEIQRILTLLRYLDDVVKQKTLRAINAMQAAPDRDSLRALLTALVEMLLVVNQKETNFRAVLFVAEENGMYLAPMVAVPFNNRPFTTLTPDGQIERKLALDGDAVATRAWKTGRVISADKSDICYFHDSQPSYLKSMIAIPLIVDPEISQLLSKRGEQVGKIIGVVCIDCDDEGYFCLERERSNLVEISPFVTRVLYEMLYTANKRSASNV